MTFAYNVSGSCKSQIGAFDYSLDEDLDIGLGRFISLVVVYVSGPGSFHTSMFDARRVIGNVRVIDNRTGSWVTKAKP